MSLTKDDLSEDIRHLIVMDTQFGWRGSTELKHEMMLRLEARGWVSEGHENAEYDLTDEGRSVINAALAAPKPAGAVPLPDPSGETYPFYGLNQPVAYGDAREAAGRGGAVPASVHSLIALWRGSTRSDKTVTGAEWNGFRSALTRCAAELEGALAAPLPQQPAAEGDSRESAMVVIKRDDSGTPTVFCDPEIADVVAALNAGGIATVASCSGHGVRAGVIALEDGRELVIVPDYDAGRRLEQLTKNHLRGDVEGIQPDVIVSPGAEGAGREAVAIIADGWDILFVGSGPIAEIARKHSLKIGDKLYTHPVADAGGVTVTNEMISRAFTLMRSYDCFARFTHDQLRECITAWLTAAFTPEVRHGE